MNNTGSRFSTNSPGSATLYPASAQPVGSYYFALFASPSTQNTISTASDPTLNGWTYVALGTNTAAAGRLNGNNSDDGQAVNVPGFAAGTSADFAVAGWSASIGNSWAQAQAYWNNGQANGPGPGGWFGINPTIADDIKLTDLTGNQYGPYNAVFGSVSGLMNGWGLINPAPEPSAFALAGLGAAALLIFRRRKV